eukprot:11989355-Prorocentrum_lima.AAC.1
MEVGIVVVPFRNRWIRSSVAKHVNQAHPEWKLLVIHLSRASGRGAMTDAISALVEESVRSEARGEWKRRCCFCAQHSDLTPSSGL